MILPTKENPIDNAVYLLCSYDLLTSRDVKKIIRRYRKRLKKENKE